MLTGVTCNLPFKGHQKTNVSSVFYPSWGQWEAPAVLAEAPLSVGTAQEVPRPALRPSELGFQRGQNPSLWNDWSICRWRPALFSWSTRKAPIKQQKLYWNHHLLIYFILCFVCEENPNFPSQKLADLHTKSVKTYNLFSMEDRIAFIHFKNSQYLLTLCKLSLYSSGLPFPKATIMTLFLPKKNLYIRHKHQNQSPNPLHSTGSSLMLLTGKVVALWTPVACNQARSCWEN